MANISTYHMQVSTRWTVSFIIIYSIDFQSALPNVVYQIGQNMHVELAMPLWLLL